MKKIIYIALLLIAFTACEKEGGPAIDFPLLNTTWEAPEEVLTEIVGELTIVSTRKKTLVFSTRSAGTITERIHATLGPDPGYSIENIKTFEYEVSGSSLYIEVEDPPASYTGKINGDKITLKGISGEDTYTKRK